MFRLITIIVVLALAAMLGGCGAQAQMQSQGDLTVTLVTDPAPPLAERATTFRIGVQQAGKSLPEGQVALQRRMPGMEHPSDKDLLFAQPLGDGRYEAQSSFVMGGRWEVVVNVTGADGQTRALAFPVEVEQP